MGGGGGTLSHQDLQNVIGTRSKGNNKLRTDMKPSVCVCECICESETHHHRLPTAILDRTRTASCCRALVLLGLLHSRGSAVCVGGLTPATGREGERSWEWSGLSPPPLPRHGGRPSACLLASLCQHLPLCGSRRGPSPPINLPTRLHLHLLVGLGPGPPPPALAWNPIMASGCSEGLQRQLGFQ